MSARIPKTRDLRGKRSGNRYDVANVMTLYLSSTLEGCYAEVLAELRPNGKLAAMVEDEWTAGSKMKPGAVNAGWRHRRSAVRVQIPRGYQFLNVEADATLDWLNAEIGAGLAPWGYSGLDFGLIHGPDRRVTRLIAQVAEALENEQGHILAGIHYESRVAAGESCWALWPGVDLDIEKSFPIEREAPELQAVARRYGLSVF